MASREEIVDVIHRAYDSRAKGDTEGVVSAFRPHGVFELKGNRDALALAGAARGHSDLHAAMKNFIDAFEFMQRDILDTIVEGDRAVVHSRLKIRFVPKNETIETEVLDIFRFEDGKIVELVEFADTALIKNLVGA